MNTCDLRINLANEDDLKKFLTLIRRFASGELKLERLASHAKVIVRPTDVEVLMIWDEAHRSRTREVVRKASSIEWRMDKEGWLETAEKVESLTPNSHAYVDGEVTIKISFAENI